VDREIRALAAIEPELLTPDGTTTKYGYYHVPNLPGAGHAYRAVLGCLTENEYSHFFWLPWLKPGGADRGALYHLRAVREANPDAKIAVFATEPSESPWAHRIPNGVDFIDFGAIVKHLDFRVQVDVATRLMVQFQPRVIHIINSRCAWDSVRRSGLAIAQGSRVFASLFCDEYAADGRAVGYARDYLRACFPFLETVFCDNSVYPKIWGADLGVPAELFTVLPFPYDGTIQQRDWPSEVSNPRVLWAGRLDWQKRPDILEAVASNVPELAFDVHGGRVVDGAVDLSGLAALPNVSMHGMFARLEDVVRPEHVAYLHTTEWEGLPTILLDVAAAGVPICAPDVGGIGDFVAPDQLIGNNTDVDAYCRALKELAGSASLRGARRRVQWSSLLGDRAWDVFVKKLFSQHGYF
jgi:glycosyltransferase involved in cell wall biosynthesis